MKARYRRIAVCCLAPVIFSFAFSGLPHTMVLAAGTNKYITVPERAIPEPEERGKKYPLPATGWKKDPVLWGWTCELPDGSGLAFGGVHQTADDGLAHTQIRKADGSWEMIIEELRKSNPLQKRCDQVRALRNLCKDTLARARHLYFEGRSAEDEARIVKAELDPAIEKMAKDITALLGELKGIKGLGAQEMGQIAFAMKHMEQAAEQIKPFGALTTPEQMAAMRKGQIELELAAEAFDCEPPPRALSKIAYEPKTKLFMIFGGEHMDYCTNDTWIFDPAQRRWFQRHQDAAPEPRFDAHLEAVGDGTIVMRGGAIRGKGYVHAGPARWIFDIEKNTWMAAGPQEKTFPSDTRIGHGYSPPGRPENYMKGSRPDAAANEAKLKALPANTWVRMDTPVKLGGRDWGTWVHDPDRDMLYVWAGGHVSYSGNDVARYHLATDRWEITDPKESPLGCEGTNEQYPSGFNFNRRPWCRKHVWNSQAYDAGLKMIIMAGANDAAIDPYCYFYDPEKADWASRLRLPKGMNNDAGVIQLRYTKHGMLAWSGISMWRLDSKAMTWSQIKVQGKIPATGVDGVGMVYDSKRDRVLLTRAGSKPPFAGQIHSLDMKTLNVVELNPEGINPPGKWDFFPREVAYDPASDLALWPHRLCLDGKAAPDLFLAYDGAKNRWLTVRLATQTRGQALPWGRWESWVNTGFAYDARRGLFWLGDASWNGGIWVLRLDAAKAEIKPLKDLVPSTPPSAAPKE